MAICDERNHPDQLPSASMHQSHGLCTSRFNAKQLTNYAPARHCIDRPKPHLYAARRQVEAPPGHPPCRCRPLGSMALS